MGSQPQPQTLVTGGMGSMFKSHVLTCPGSLLWASVLCPPLSGFWASCAEQIISASSHGCSDSSSQELALWSWEDTILLFCDIYISHPTSFN